MLLKVRLPLVKSEVLLIVISSVSVSAYAVRLMPGNSPTAIASVSKKASSFLPVLCFIKKSPFAPPVRAAIVYGLCCECDDLSAWRRLRRVVHIAI
jgi:hypothetical protein